MQQLEQRIRRSSRLKQNSVFREFLTYASMVSDEDQIFSYMEENKIGVQQPQFWAAKLTMLKNKCMYSQFIKVLKNIHRNHQLKRHPKYWLITQIQNQLQRYLQRILRRKVKGKRSAKQYQVLNYLNIQKQTRKFGKIQVYVDPDCRLQYRLQNLIQFVNNRLPEQCQVEKNCYEREVAKRPLSFLGKNKERLNLISDEVLKFMNNRQRQSLRNSININGNTNFNNRRSMVGRKSNKLDGDFSQTPDFKKKSCSKESNKKRNKQNVNMRDSIQILKNLARKSIAVYKRQQMMTPPKKHENNPEIGLQQFSSIKKQRVRMSPKKQDQILSQPQPDADVCSDIMFSFGDRKQYMFASQRISRTKRQQDNSFNKSFDNNDKNENHGDENENNHAQSQNLISIYNCSQQFPNHSQKDHAFIEYQAQQTQINDKNINDRNGDENMINKDQQKKQSATDLQNIIKQIQMQKYESQTFSQIDSNKQNNLVFGQQNNNNISFGSTDHQFVINASDSAGSLNDILARGDFQHESHKDRRKFQTLKKQSIKNSRKRQKQMQKQMVDQEQMDESSQAIYSQLLSYLDHGASSHKNSKNQSRVSLSQKSKNKKTRISRISQERSYSFSQTRPKSHHDDN